MNAARHVTSGIVFLAFMLLTACATVPLQQLRGSDLPSHYELVDTVFFPQDEYQCGPAALATVLAGARITTTPEALVPQVYLPKRKGSIQIELIAATRRHERVPYVIRPELEALLHEVASGNSVLVLENLGLSWLPLWHYAVVVGYDLERAEIVSRSGRERREVLAMETFERIWARGNRWGLVVTPLDRVPATAEENNFVQAVAQLEAQERFAAASRAYEAATRRWPNSIIAKFGLGNSYYGLKNYTAAERVYREVIERQRDSGAAWNNLAQALMEQKRWDEAEIAARTALQFGGVTEGAARSTLEEVTARRR